jgi:signal transduction histidine kinase
LQTRFEGLTDREANERLRVYGFNKIKAEKRISKAAIFAKQMKEPLIIILLAAITISAFVGELVDAIIIVAIVILSTIVGFIQGFKSEKAIEALKKMTAATCRVIRNNEESIIEVLLSKRGNIEEYDDFLNGINRNAKRLHQLAENILDVTKIESQSLHLKKQRFSLNDIIQSVLTDYQRLVDSSKVRLAMTPNDDIAIVEGDKERLTQVLDNILSNAIKLTEEGKITVTLEIMKEKDKQNVVVSVKDTGSGIDSEILSRLFTRFVTKSDRGTGLGLYISKGIIEAHGGKVWAENNLKEMGATVNFSLTIV